MLGFSFCCLFFVLICFVCIFYFILIEINFQFNNRPIDTYHDMAACNPDRKDHGFHKPEENLPECNNMCNDVARDQAAKDWFAFLCHRYAELKSGNLIIKEMFDISNR